MIAKGTGKSGLTKTKSIVKKKKGISISSSVKITKNKLVAKKMDVNRAIPKHKAGQKINSELLISKTLILGRFLPYQPAINEKYMNETQRAHFKKILELWKKNLIEDMDNAFNDMKEASVLPDLNDRASQEETFNLSLRTRDRECKLIQKIANALKQLDDDEYGYCESCGVEIGIRRLEARPTASLCIECKTLAEIREKRL